jgi:hypothetical protein
MRWHPLHNLLLPLLLGCSETKPTQDSGPPKGLACSDAVNGCSCVPAAPPIGACSPTTLGGSAQCCGSASQCYCAKSGTCYTQGMNLCVCNAQGTPDGGMNAPSCPKPMNGHCCKAITDAAQGSCQCSGNMCNAMTEMEVTSCSGSDGNLTCSATTMSVPSCQ